MKFGDLMAVLLAMAVLFVVLAMSELDYQEAERKERLYCEMVGIWHESSGLYGWPPHRKEVDCGYE